MRLRIAIVVAIAGALLGFATGCGAKPAADEAGLLVYDVSTLNGTAAAGLWVVDDQGGHRRRLTGPSLPASASYAEWSPKGGTILFWSDLTTAEEFWTIGADGTNLRQVGRGYGATWSPDGREIAIEVGDGLSIVDSDGSPRRTIRLGLDKDEEPDGLHWSPDGSRIALDASGRDTTAHVAVVAADGKSPAEVFRGENEPGVSEWFADWSPDGKSIAFVRGLTANDDGPVSAWVMRSDGSGRRLIAADAGAVAFSTDGRSFLYVAGSPEGPALYRVPITGGEPKKLGLAPKDGLIEDPLVEPGGSRVIDLLAGRLVVRDADGTARELLAAPHEDSAPVWSPDGRQIAFVRGREWGGKGDVYLVNEAGKGERLVAQDGAPEWLHDGRLVIERGKGFAYADLHPERIAVPVEGTNWSVSPDGSLIAFVRNRSAPGPQVHGEGGRIDVQSTLYVRSWAGGPERALAETAGSDSQPIVFARPVWAHDGRSLFVLEEDPGFTSFRIRQIPVVGGGEGRTVVRGYDLELFAVAPDGKRIAVAVFARGIDLVELEGGKRTTLVPWVSPSDLEWSPDGDKLAYVADNDDDESVFDLYVVDADGNDRRRVSRPGDAVNSFEWHPDGVPRESR